MPTLPHAYPPEPPPGEDELPCSDGEPMDTERHGKQQVLLTSSLERAWDDRSDFYVGGNMFVYYSELQRKQNDFRGPDVFVVLDTIRRERKSWIVWAENGRMPDVVIELLSPTTEHVDRGEKMRIYAQLLRVSFYYLFDPFTGVLEGYELDHSARAYVGLAPLPNGDFPCPVLGLRLGVRSGRYEGIETEWLRWLDAEGRPLPTDEERLADSERRFAEQTKAREDSEHRLAEALAELERLKASQA
jgi:Uma2 family endonuclease